jgi:hypothetical protein
VTKYCVWYGGQRLMTCASLEAAQTAVRTHPDYKKSWYTRKGDPSSRHPQGKAGLAFRIYDSQGYGWYI